MIKIYDDYEKGRVKVFFNIKNNEVTSVVVGNRAVSHEQGFQFYVDQHVAEQLHKTELYLEGITPKLKVKKGERIIVPAELEEREKEIYELESRLRELRSDDHAE